MASGHYYCVCYPLRRRVRPCRQLLRRRAVDGTDRSRRAVRVGGVLRPALRLGPGERSGGSVVGELVQLVAAGLVAGLVAALVVAKAVAMVEGLEAGLVEVATAAGATEAVAQEAVMAAAATVVVALVAVFAAAAAWAAGSAAAGLEAAVSAAVAPTEARSDRCSSSRRIFATRRQRSRCWASARSPRGCCWCPHVRQLCSLNRPCSSPLPRRALAAACPRGLCSSLASRRGR